MILGFSGLQSSQEFSPDLVKCHLRKASGTTLQLANESGDTPVVTRIMQGKTHKQTAKELHQIIDENHVDGISNR